MDTATLIKLFEHCRLIIGMVVSLAIARLLNGLAKFVQHPRKVRVYSVHLCWVFCTLLLIIHFWWWEFKLRVLLQAWTFEAYLFVISYAITFFMLCALLFPDQMEEYKGFEDYFISRRFWFFGILGFAFIMDIIDTSLKGAAYFSNLGLEYLLRNSFFIIFSVLAMFVVNRRFQLFFAISALIYEITFIFRLFHTAQ